MTSFIVAMTVVISLIGVGVAIWSIISTRKKYYQEYMGRKKND